MRDVKNIGNLECIRKHTRAVEPSSLAGYHPSPWWLLATQSAYMPVRAVCATASSFHHLNMTLAIIMGASSWVWLLGSIEPLWYLSSRSLFTQNLTYESHTILK